VRNPEQCLAQETGDVVELGRQHAFAFAQDATLLLQVFCLRGVAFAMQRPDLFAQRVDLGAQLVALGDDGSHAIVGHEARFSSPSRLPSALRASPASTPSKSVRMRRMSSIGGTLVGRR